MYIRKGFRDWSWKTNLRGYLSKGLLVIKQNFSWWRFNMVDLIRIGFVLVFQIIDKYSLNWKRILYKKLVSWKHLNKLANLLEILEHVADLIVSITDTWAMEGGTVDNILEDFLYSLYTLFLSNICDKIVVFISFCRFLVVLLFTKT
jgi:hypothetical protein